MSGCFRVGKCDDGIFYDTCTLVGDCDDLTTFCEEAPEDGGVGLYRDCWVPETPFFDSDDLPVYEPQPEPQSIDESAKKFGDKDAIIKKYCKDTGKVEHLECFFPEHVSPPDAVTDCNLSANGGDFGQKCRLPKEGAKKAEADAGAGVAAEEAGAAPKVKAKPKGEVLKVPVHAQKDEEGENERVVYLFETVGVLSDKLPMFAGMIPDLKVFAGAAVRNLAQEAAEEDPSTDEIFLPMDEVQKHIDIVAAAFQTAQNPPEKALMEAASQQVLEEVKKAIQEGGETGRQAEMYIKGMIEQAKNAGEDEAAKRLETLLREAKGGKPAAGKEKPADGKGKKAAAEKPADGKGKKAAAEKPADGKAKKDPAEKPKSGGGKKSGGKKKGSAKDLLGGVDV